MRSFMYTLKIPTGMHARHAGLFVKAVNQYVSRVSVTYGDKTVDGRRLLALMSLGIKQEGLIRVDVEGPDEDVAAVKLKAYVWENL